MALSAPKYQPINFFSDTNCTNCYDEFHLLYNVGDAVQFWTTDTFLQNQENIVENGNFDTTLNDWDNPATPPLNWSALPTGGARPGVSDSGFLLQDLGVFAMGCEKISVCFTVSGLNPDGLEYIKCALTDNIGTSGINVFEVNQNGSYCFVFDTTFEPTYTYLTFSTRYNSSPPSSITSNVILTGVSARCYGDCTEIDFLDNDGNVLFNTDSYATQHIFDDLSRITAWSITPEFTPQCFQIRATCGEEEIFSDFMELRALSQAQKCDNPLIQAGKGAVDDKYIFNIFWFDNSFANISFRIPSKIRNFSGGGENVVFNYVQQFASIDSFVTFQTGFLDEWRLRALNYASQFDTFLVQDEGRGIFNSYVRTDAAFEPIYLQQWLLGSVEMKLLEQNGIQQNNYC